jgi:hypothetical protein
MKNQETITSHHLVANDITNHWTYRMARVSTETLPLSSGDVPWRGGQICQWESTDAYWKTILFLKTPIPGISTSTTSPSCKNVFGFMNAPTPAGVPVMTAVNAGIVVPICAAQFPFSSTKPRPAKSNLELTLAHVAQNYLWRKDDIAFQIGRLSCLPIDPHHDISLSAIVTSWLQRSRKNLGADESWTERGELVERLGIEELAPAVRWQLEQTTRKVVSKCIAQDAGFGLGRGCVAKDFGCQKYQLGLKCCKSLLGIGAMCMYNIILRIPRNRASSWHKSR